MYVVGCARPRHVESILSRYEKICNCSSTGRRGRFACVECVGSSESRRVKSSVTTKLNGPSSSQGVVTSVVYVEAVELILLMEGLSVEDAIVGVEKGLLKWTDGVVVCAGAEAGGVVAGLLILRILLAKEPSAACKESRSPLSR